MPSIVYSVDAGGSGTVVAVWRAGVVVDTSFYPSIAIASTGTTAACQSLSDVLRGITEHVGKDSWALGCIGSSSIAVAAEAPAPKPLIDVIAMHAPRGRVVLVNDVVPLLWSTPLAGVGIVICSGTGSSVLGRNAGGQQTKVGGHEHIVSDQGSAIASRAKACGLPVVPIRHRTDHKTAGPRRELLRLADPGSWPLARGTAAATYDDRQLRATGNGGR